LTSIDSVRRSYIGVPAATDRPVIERGYSYSLILTFEDQPGHDLYQEHDVHERFRQECSPYWSKVVIYDCVEALHIED
jgi:Stress responsive A/B Barrel Domain